MTIKTYRGRTLADALQRVKQDLGPDAVILNTRTYKTGGVLGIGASTIAEIAATSHVDAPRRIRAERSNSAVASAATSRGGSPKPGALRPAPASAATIAPGGTSARISSTGSPRGSAPAPGIHAAESPPRDPPDGNSRAASAAIASTRPDAVELSATVSRAAAVRETVMAREIADLKRMVGQVLRSSTSVGLASSGDALVDAYSKLIGAEVASELAEGIIAKVRAEVPSQRHHDREAVRAAVLKELAAMVQVDDAVGPVGRAADGRPAVIALIGPTGVGKTTTIAKLAATYRLRHGMRVSLITADTYRIAAVDQLRTYANIIGLPLRVVLTPADMQAAVEASAGCDVVLIDTAGRAPRDENRLSELSAMLEAARPTQTHLCLSSAASEAVMTEAARCFGALAPSHLIFTKLDEAVNFGVLINLAHRIDARLSFITTGQEVPDQIEPGDPLRLAAMVMDGGQPS